MHIWGFGTNGHAPTLSPGILTGRRRRSYSRLKQIGRLISPGSGRPRGSSLRRILYRNKLSPLATFAIKVVRESVTCSTGVDRLGGGNGRGAWGRSGNNNAPKLPKMPLARRLELEEERQSSNNEIDVDFYTLCVPVWSCERFGALAALTSSSRKTSYSSLPKVSLTVSACHQYTVAK